MRWIRVLFRLAVLAAVAILAGWLVWKNLPPFSDGFHDPSAAAAAEAPAAGPSVGRCAMYPADNVWNTPIDSLPFDRRSIAYIASIGARTTLHPDFGSSPLSGIPYSDVPPGTPPVPVTFGYVDESDPGPYPIPSDAPIEGGREAYGDRHILLVDQQRCILYELFEVQPHPDGSWEAGSGEIYPMNSNQLRAEGRGSADAAGLAILPGLVRYDEVAAGRIAHALRFTIPHTQAAFVWPARHKASRITDPDVAPMGQRFRLRADYDISGFSKANQVILTALKRYGMILADNGGGIFLSGAPDKRWDDEDLHTLSRVTAADFDAVDESGLQVAKDSAQARTSAGR